MDADPKLATLATAVCDRVRVLIDACPERRDLVHGDLLHGNVLVSADSHRVEAVISWKRSLRGDFLYDAAVRHRCYALQIAFTHLGWSLGTWDPQHLDATIDLLAEMLDRGPVALPAD